MSGDLKLTNNTLPLTLGKFRGKCFVTLSKGILHIKVAEQSTTNRTVCLTLCGRELVTLPDDIEIRPVDVEILIT